MRALVQRVKSASVTVDGQPTGVIGPGLLVFLALAREDTPAHAERLIGRLLAARLFENGQGKLDYNVQDLNAEILLVSQFTLLANTTTGRRPDFHNALPPAQACELYDVFASRLKAAWPRVQTGVFGAHMQVSLVNDGPFTVQYDV